MRLIYAKLKHNLLQIGRRRENLATQVVFEGYPEEGYSVQVFVKRNGDTVAYPASNVIIDSTDRVIRWNVTATDTDKQGTGEVQFRYSNASGVVVKTEVFSFNVTKAIDADAGPAPDPYESWLESLTDLADSAQESAREAAASAQSIQTMTVETETLEEGASATASWDDGTLTLGIPRGATGARGPKGDDAVMYVIEFSASAIVYDATKAAGSQFTPASGLLRASFYKIEGATKTAYRTSRATTDITTPDAPEVNGVRVEFEESVARNVSYVNISYPSDMSGNSEVYVRIDTPDGYVSTTIPVISCGPKGDKGDKGDTGATGPQGAQGADTVTYEILPSSSAIVYDPNAAVGSRLFPSDMAFYFYQTINGQRSRYLTPYALVSISFPDETGDYVEDYNVISIYLGSLPNKLDDKSRLECYMELPDGNVTYITVPIIACGLKGDTGATGQGVPSGGTAGQFLVKSSGTDYDTEWVTLQTWEGGSY